MKKVFFASLATLICVTTFSQTANVTWGDEFKLRKGSTDLEVIYTDPTGIFVKESHFALKTYFVIGATVRESATLIKLDKNLTEIYSNGFNKELKGKEFERFYFIKNKAYLLASDYNKKDKTLTLFGAEINKETGELSGDWIEITSWTKDEKREDISFRAAYNADSSKMILVSSIEGREKINYELRTFDPSLKMIGKAIAITNEFEPRLYSLEDVVYTHNDNVVLVGREFEYQEGKKKKDKFRDFKNYNIRVYDNSGKQIKEINTAVDGKWLISARVAQTLNRELVLAAFYSNERRGRETNGMLVQRINPANGEIISTSNKEINTSMITALEDGNDDDDDESKKERKERERLEKIQNEEDGFSRYLRFRNFVPTDDGGLIILAEKYNSYTYTTTQSRGGFGNSPTTWQTTTYRVYECGDILMSKLEGAKGVISWLHVVPKQQREVFQLASNTGTTGIGFNTYFDLGMNWPFYAGIGILPGSGTLNIIFNDHKKNDKVLQLGQKVKRISYFRRTDCFAIALNTVSGKYTRSVLFSNNDVPTAMPRLSSMLGKDLYMIGKEDRMLGKTKIAIAKLSLK